jgi:hypothetical protein
MSAKPTRIAKRDVNDGFVILVSFACFVNASVITDAA